MAEIKTKFTGARSASTLAPVTLVLVSAIGGSWVAGSRAGGECDAQRTAVEKRRHQQTMRLGVGAPRLGVCDLVAVAIPTYAVAARAAEYIGCRTALVVQRLQVVMPVVSLEAALSLDGCYGIVAKSFQFVAPRTS